MAIEYRVYYIPDGKSAVMDGYTGYSYADGLGLIWKGETGTFPETEYPNSRVLSASDVQRIYLEQLQRRTMGLIEASLPQWRLNRWRRYYDISLKVKANVQLSQVEQKEYDCFPSPGETHDICFAYVTDALEWAADVIAEHNRVEALIRSTTDAVDVEIAFNQVAYPSNNEGQTIPADNN